MQQISERKALPMIEAGDIEGAITACANIWASSPGNCYRQGGHSLETLVGKYQELLTAPTLIRPVTIAA